LSWNCWAEFIRGWGLSPHEQGRNFGLKSGGTNSEGERGAIGPPGEGGEEWGGSIPSSSDFWAWESVVSSPSRVQAEPDHKRFYNNLISADRVCWQQVLHLFVLKSGGTVPSVQKVGVPVPLVPPKLRLCPRARVTVVNNNSDAKCEQLCSCDTRFSRNIQNLNLQPLDPTTGAPLQTLVIGLRFRARHISSIASGPNSTLTFWFYWQYSTLSWIVIQWCRRYFFSIAFWLTVTRFSNLFYHNNMKLNIISYLDNMTDYLFRKLLT